MVSDEGPVALYHLVDNRIVLGESSPISPIQPKVVCVLHPRQTEPEHFDLIRAMLAEVNLVRKGYHRGGIARPAVMYLVGERAGESILPVEGEATASPYIDRSVSGD